MIPQAASLYQQQLHTKIQNPKQQKLALKKIAEMRLAPVMRKKDAQLTSHGHKTNAKL